MSNKQEVASMDKEPDGRSFPKTSTQMVGWKLEKTAPTTPSEYGIHEKRARSKGELLRALGWPREAI